MKKCLFLAATIMFAVCANAQKFKPAPDFLKGQTEINVVFDFSNVVFDKDAQQAYYKDKGKAWVAKWEGEKRTMIIGSFVENANEELKKKSSVRIGEFPKAEFTMIVEVLNCDFGAYAGPMSVPAKVKATIKFVKTGTTEVLSTITLKENQNPYTAVGTPVDYDRMNLAFGELGESVGEKLVKVVK